MSGQYRWNKQSVCPCDGCLVGWQVRSICGCGYAWIAVQSVHHKRTGCSKSVSLFERRLRSGATFDSKQNDEFDVNQSSGNRCQGGWSYSTKKIVNDWSARQRVKDHFDPVSWSAIRMRRDLNFVQKFCFDRIELIKAVSIGFWSTEH